MEVNKKEELLKLIDCRISESGIGYLRSYPEDDCESGRDWSELHNEWSSAIYGLLEIKDLLNEL
jgi:hypothetical protein